MKQRLGALDWAGPGDGFERCGVDRVEGGRAGTRGRRIGNRCCIKQSYVTRSACEFRMRVVRRYPGMEAWDAFLYRIRRIYQRVVFAESRKSERDVRRIWRNELG